MSRSPFPVQPRPPLDHRETRIWLRFDKGTPRYFTSGVGDHTPELVHLEEAFAVMHPLNTNNPYHPAYKLPKQRRSTTRA